MRKSHPVVTLDQVAESIVDGPFGSNLKTSDYVDSGVPVLQGKNITGNKFVWKEVRYITEQKAERLKRSSTAVGDHLLVKIGSIGYSAILDDLNGHDQAIIPANLARLRPNRDVVDDRYLHRVLTSETLRRHFQKVASKTAQPALSLKKIKATQIPLPPLAEQKRIAAILDAADALRAKRRETLAELDTLIQATFLDMFGHPVTNPKGWEVAALGDVIKVGSGNGLVSKDMVTDGEFPVYGGNGINGYHDEYMFEDPVVVLGRVGVYCGVVHVTKPRSWVTDNALIVKELLRTIETTYLVEALRMANLNQYASQAAQPLISGSRVYPVEVLLPPLRVQERFARSISHIELHRERLQRHKAGLDVLFASLQARAFNGEL